MIKALYDVTDISRFLIKDGGEASIVTWQGHPCLRLNGLAILPDVQLSEGSIEVDIGSDDASYCGIAFRIRDTLNYELAYAQPHTSGRWDALQYDPVFHGCNTWQLYHGPGTQLAADVPKGEWFHLKVGFKDQQAVVQVNDQAPLIIPRLAYPSSSGFVGLWCYLPAYFRNLSISGDAGMYAHLTGEIDMPEHHDDLNGLITEWFLHDYGQVQCDANGTLNLNRYLPLAVTEARLTRKFQLHEPAHVTLNFGFSDEISIRLDGEMVYEGENKFQGITNTLGYVSLDKQVSRSMPAGTHTLDILLRRTEYFGFGLRAQLAANHCKLWPCV
jgi:hypothetical protein